MPEASVEVFLAHLEQSRLLSADRLAQARIQAARSPDADATETATQLVEQGLITQWQADRCLDGHHDFFMGKYKLLEPGKMRIALNTHRDGL